MKRSVMLPNGSSVVRYVQVAPRCRRPSSAAAVDPARASGFLFDRPLRLAEHRVDLLHELARRGSPPGEPAPDHRRAHVDHRGQVVGPQIVDRRVRATTRSGARDGRCDRQDLLPPRLDHPALGLDHGLVLAQEQAHVEALTFDTRHLKRGRRVGASALGRVARRRKMLAGDEELRLPGITLAASAGRRS